MNRRLLLPLVLPLLLPVLAHAQSAVDERAIITAVAELDAAVDAKDWERARALLLDEVSVVLPGEQARRMPAEELVEHWRTTFHGGKTSFHLRGGERVVFDGADSAVLRSKAHVWQRLPAVAGDELYEVWSDYHHELDRTEDGWRVRHHGVATRLERGNLAVLEHRPPDPDGTTDAGSADEALPDEPVDEGAPEADDDVTTPSGERDGTGATSGDAPPAADDATVPDGDDAGEDAPADGD